MFPFDNSDGSDARFFALLLVPAVLLALYATRVNLLEASENLSYPRISLLFAVKVVHAYYGLFLFTYVFRYGATSSNSLDALYLAAYFTMILSWTLFRNECLFNFAENKIVDPAYVLGADPYAQTRPMKNFYVLLQTYFYLVALFVVWRFSTVFKNKLAAVAFAVTLILLATVNVKRFVTGIKAAAPAQSA